MKRSEMIELIHSRISHELQTTEEFNIDDCDELLYAMERAGMLPPRHDFMIGHMKASDNIWEPEE